MADQTRGDRPGFDRYEGITEEDRADKVDAWTQHFLDRLGKMDKLVTRVYERATYDQYTQRDLNQLRKDIAALKTAFVP